jgi:glycosyltransferase involved in cell wall biosynthesis
MPQLTVLLTSYNYSTLLPDALDSIMAQLGDNELVAVDDGSTDGSRELLEALATRDSRLRLCVHPTNRGVHAALASGLALAQGKYLLCAAADDKILPGLIERSLAALEMNSKAGFFTAPVEFINPRGSIIDTWRGPRLEGRYNGPEQARAYMRRYGFWFCGATTVFRRDALMAAGGFPHDLGNLADSFITQVVALRCGFCSASAPLAQVRADVRSYSSMERQNLSATYPTRVAAVKRMKDLPALFPEAFIREWLAVWSFLDALKAWQGTSVEGARRILVQDVHLFREKVTLLDRVFILGLQLGAAGQLALFSVWGVVTLCRYRLFWRYLAPHRLIGWIRKQFA